jgi:hypothetical protein
MADEPRAKTPLEKARERPGRIKAEQGTPQAANPGELFRDDNYGLWYMYGPENAVPIYPPPAQAALKAVQTNLVSSPLPVQAFWSGTVFVRENAFVWYAPRACSLSGVVARLADPLPGGVVPLNLYVHAGTMAFVVTINPGEDTATVPLEPIALPAGGAVAIDVLQAVAVVALSVQLR